MSRLFILFHSVRRLFRRSKGTFGRGSAPTHKAKLVKARSASLAAAGTKPALDAAKEVSMSAPRRNGMRAIFTVVVAAAWVGCGLGPNETATEGDPVSATTMLFEGESMSFPSGKGGIVSDGAASGGSALELWSNATADKSASFSS